MAESDSNPEDWASLDYDAMWQVRRQARRNALRKKPNRKSFEKYWDDYESELGGPGYWNIKRNPNKPSILSQTYGPTSDRDWDEDVPPLYSGRYQRGSESQEQESLAAGDFSGLSDLRPTTATGSSRVRAHQFIPQKDDWGEITNPMEMYGDLYIRFQRAAKSGATAGKDLYYFGEMTLGEYVQFKNSSSLGKAINELGDDYTWDIRNTPPDLLI